MAFVTSGYSAQNVQRDSELTAIAEDSETRDNLGGTFVGQFAGDTNTGRNVTAFGLFALNRNVGDDNVALGTNTGLTNTTGSSNIFLGSHAGANNTTGNHNIFLGPYSGFQNQNGAWNINIGSDTARLLTNRSYNVCIGHKSSLSNFTLNDSILVGHCNDCENSKNIVIGNNGWNRGDKSILMGHNITNWGSNSIALGNNVMNYGHNSIVVNIRDTPFVNNKNNALVLTSDSVFLDNGSQSFIIDADSNDIIISNGINSIRLNSNNISLSGNTTFQDDVSITGNMQAKSVKFDDNLTTNQLTVNGLAVFADDVTFSTDIGVSGNIDTLGSIFVTESVTCNSLEASTIVSTAQFVANTALFEGNVTLCNTLFSEQQAQIRHVTSTLLTVSQEAEMFDLRVNGLSEHVGDVFMLAALNVYGNIQLSSNIVIIGETRMLSNCICELDALFKQTLVCRDLVVEGNSTIQNLDVYGPMHINSNLTALGHVFLNESLTVQGTLALNGPISIYADSTSTCNVFVKGNVSISNALLCQTSTSMYAFVSCNLTVTNDSVLNENLAVHGDTVLHGDVSCSSQLAVQCNLTCPAFISSADNIEFAVPSYFTHDVSLLRNVAIKSNADTVNVFICEVPVECLNDFVCSASIFGDSIILNDNVVAGNEITANKAHFDDRMTIGTRDPILNSWSKEQMICGVDALYRSNVVFYGVIHASNTCFFSSGLVACNDVVLGEMYTQSSSHNTLNASNVFCDTITVFNDLDSKGGFQAQTIHVEDSYMKNVTSSNAFVDNFQSRLGLVESLEINNAFVSNANIDNAEIETTYVNFLRATTCEATNVYSSNVNTMMLLASNVDIDYANVSVLSNDIGYVNQLTASNVIALQATIDQQLEAHIANIDNLYCDVAQTNVLSNSTQLSSKLGLMENMYISETTYSCNLDVTTMICKTADINTLQVHHISAASAVVQSMSNQNLSCLVIASSNATSFTSSNTFLDVSSNLRVRGIAQIHTLHVTDTAQVPFGSFVLADVSNRLNTEDLVVNGELRFSGAGRATFEDRASFTSLTTSTLSVVSDVNIGRYMYGNHKYVYLGYGFPIQYNSITIEVNGWYILPFFNVIHTKGTHGFSVDITDGHILIETGGVFSINVYVRANDMYLTTGVVGILIDNLASSPFDEVNVQFIKHLSTSPVASAHFECHLNSGDILRIVSKYDLGADPTSTSSSYSFDDNSCITLRLVDATA